MALQRRKSGRAPLAQRTGAGARAQHRPTSCPATAAPRCRRSTPWGASRGWPGARAAAHHRARHGTRWVGGRFRV